MIGARRSSGSVGRGRGVAATAAFVLAMTLTAVIESAEPAVAALPTGFSEVTAFGGLANPTAVKFAPDGKVFVAEKRGTIQMFDGLEDATATTVIDLRTEVYNFWDRGLLGLAVDPAFPGTPVIYAMYTFDGVIGGTAPRWGSPGADSDDCPSPPGPTTDGCVVSSKLVRITLDLANPGVATTQKTDLIHDWCQQYPSHSAGDLVFGNDGALYASGGDGASYDFVDYGQEGAPTINPCGDPGGAMTPPTAEGGALRSQDLRTPADPVSLDGTIVRVDPASGAAMAGNPNMAATDANARRIVAYGLRNSFRMTTRPGTGELWFGDVGWGSFEEINRLTNPVGGVTNFGWPCYEGPGRNNEYDNTNLSICENLYAQGGDTKPFFSYGHGQKLNAADTCGFSTGSSGSGVAFGLTSGSPYPAEYDGALFFADYARNCIWVMTRGADGQPAPASARPFLTPAALPVDLEMSPSGELFYADVAGSIRRITYGGTTPPPPPPPPSGTCPAGQYTAEYFANKTLTGTPGATACEAGPMLNKDWALAAPATGIPADNWSARYAGSIDFPTATTYTFTAQADDGIRVWIDGTILIDQWRDQEATFTATRALAAGVHQVRVEFFDSFQEAVAKVSWVGAPPPPSATAPAPVIDTPVVGANWKVGDLVSFTGSATDPQDGVLPASALRWETVLQHCPSACHAHPLQTFTGVAGGQFTAPDHEFPAYVDLKLTATDSTGATTTVTRRLDPRTVPITVNTVPQGLSVTFGSKTGITPFTTTLIEGSVSGLSAPSPMTLNGTSYNFTSWSDGGGQSHNIVAGATAATYTATYTAAGVGPPPTSCLTAQFLAEYFTNKTLTGTPASQTCEAGPLNKDWGMGAPTGVGPDNFSARWTGTFDFASPGSYTFTAAADDGIRVYVDGTILIDQWKDQAVTTYTAARTLTAGPHQVRVEFFDSYEEAVAKVSWLATPTTPTACVTGQYLAQYFGNTTLSGAPARTVCEAGPLNKSWGTGGPPGVPVNNFTVRWTGTFNFTAGSKTFTAATDDGVRVWLDDVLIINRWNTSGTTRTTRTVTAGTHVVKVEYIERTGSATARVTW